MPTTNQQWADAFARQAKSDYRLYRVLEEQLPPVDLCHRLHVLQMACEKIAKACKLRYWTGEPRHEMRSHVGFAKSMAAFASSATAKSLVNTPGKQSRPRSW